MWKKKFKLLYLQGSWIIQINSYNIVLKQKKMHRVRPKCDN